MPYRPTANYRECLHLNEIPDATPSAAGVMSAADKAKLDGLGALGGDAAVVAQARAPRALRRRQARPASACTIRCKLAIFAIRFDLRVSIPREFFTKK